MGPKLESKYIQITIYHYLDSKVNEGIQAQAAKDYRVL